MKKIFALNLLLLSAAAQAQQMPYFAINNPDNNGTGNTAALFSLNSTSTAFLHGSREWPTLSAKTNNGIATYIPDNSFNGPAGSPLTINFSVTGSSASPFFKGTACSSSCGTTGYTATTSYSDTSMVVKPPVIEPGTAYGRWVLGDPFFDYLLNAAPGNEVTITSTPQISSIGKVTTTNTLHKVGTLTMTNSRALDLGIDPISGEVTIVDGSTGATCTKYTRNTVSGVLCELLEYTFVGEDITGYNPGLALTSSRVNGVLQSHMNGGTGLAAEITFDESNWYSISGGILSDTRVLANTFLAAPQKNGGKAYLKIFLPKALILSVAQAGDGNNIGNIVSLCLTRVTARWRRISASSRGAGW
ncbi:hypothetical protein [Enterobacter cloacae]|uniref:hypothetical protein n=1 Tax=Enterobacter cloacae TaxID=550 RepID=UPI001CDA95AB|nr:hypothetical protein [Enterobacter cloacae]MCQ4385276.1 hypothetical protein [Enterobacter cloacae]